MWEESYGFFTMYWLPLFLWQQLSWNGYSPPQMLEEEAVMGIWKVDAGI
jgi:hypothetical protein